MGWRRAKERNHRLKKLADNHGHSWYDEEKGRYIKYYLTNNGAKGRIKWIKRQSARKIRRSKEHFSQHGKHHRLYDYWWEVY